jgi:hypothetical protein
MAGDRQCTNCGRDLDEHEGAQETCPGGSGLFTRVLDFDRAEALGLDGTGRDGDPRFPYVETSYEVCWSIEVSAFDPRDAARQAWTMLSDAAIGVGVATMLVVRRVSDEKKVGVFDMAEPEQELAVADG